MSFPEQQPELMMMEQYLIIEPYPFAISLSHLPHVFVVQSISRHETPCRCAIWYWPIACSRELKENSLRLVLVWPRWYLINCFNRVFVPNIAAGIRNLVIFISENLDMFVSIVLKMGVCGFFIYSMAHSSGWNWPISFDREFLLGII